MKRGKIKSRLTLYHVDDLVVGGFGDDPPRVDFDDDVVLSDTGTIGRTARAYRLVRRQSNMLEKMAVKVAEY